MITVEKLSKKRVMAAGHICLDITPAFHKKSAGGLSQVFLPGKLIHVGQPDIHIGGSVANTGLALQYFGVDVCLTGKVGEDEFGHIIRRQLDRYDCEARLIGDPNAATSYSVVIAVPGADRIFLHNPGANDTFCAQDVTDELLEGIDHFHFGYPPLMARMVEDGGRQLEILFSRVKSKGITTSLDMAAVDPASPAGRINWLGILSRVLPLTDFFLPSIEETGFMLDQMRYDEWNARARGGDVIGVLSVTEDIAPLANRLTELGAKTILLKCGELGIYYRTSERTQMLPLCQVRDLDIDAWSGLAGFVPSYLPDRVVAATGAGDSCIAAFLTAMLQGRALVNCVHLAAAAGACCVSAYDSLSGLVPLEELERRIRAGWPQAQ